MEMDEITITEGQDFTLSLVMLDEEDNPIPLDGFTVESKWRESFAQDSATLATFTYTIADPADGEIILSLVAAQTLNLLNVRNPKVYAVPAGFMDAFIINPTGTRELVYRAAVTYEQSVSAGGA